MNLFEFIEEIHDSKKRNWVEQAKWSQARYEEVFPAVVNGKVQGQTLQCPL